VYDLHLNNYKLTLIEKVYGLKSINEFLFCNPSLKAGVSQAQYK